MRRLLVSLALLASLALTAPAGAAPVKLYKGKLVVRHTDDFRHGLGETTWTLRTKRGRELPLRPDRAPLARSGTKVKVKGRRVGPWLEGAVRRRGGAPLHAATALGTHKVAVILVNFPTDTRTPWTPAQVAGRVFTDSDSTAAFYDEESYGNIHLTGDVLGWYTIAGPTDGCDVDAWAAQARDAAAADGRNLSLYDHVAYVFPQQSSCGWAGLGEMPGSQVWINGTTAVRVIAHELGHNMGLHHASSYSCTSGGAAVTLSSSCTASEYGDPFDVMGLNPRHNSAWHLSRLGVLSGSDVQVVNASGTYTVRSAVTDGSGAALLRIPAGGTPARYYDVSLRQAGGVFDNYLSNDPVVNGVSVHYDVAGTQRVQSLLLDNTPGSGSGFMDSPLAQGRTFSAGDVSITASSVSPGLATVDVVVGAFGRLREPVGHERGAGLVGIDRQRRRDRLPRLSRLRARRHGAHARVRRHRPRARHELPLPGGRVRRRRQHHAVGAAVRDRAGRPGRQRRTAASASAARRHAGARGPDRVARKERPPAQERGDQRERDRRHRCRPGRALDRRPAGRAGGRQPDQEDVVAARGSARSARGHGPGLRRRRERRDEVRAREGRGREVVAAQAVLTTAPAGGRVEATHFNSKFPQEDSCRAPLALSGRPNPARRSRFRTRSC
jgi:hypothetical protein